jgi:SRSO17 transposase
MKTLPIVEYPRIIREFIPVFKPVFTKPQLRHFAEYLTGLITCSNKTVQGINDSFVCHRDQSAKNHFLTAADWPEDAVNRKRLGLIREVIDKDHIQDGQLVLDDSLAHKSGKKIDGVGWHYDHSQNKTVLGHQIVSTHYCCRSFHVPLDFAVYRKDGGFDKNQLARQLIDRAVATDLPFSTVLCDSWYFSEENVRHIEFCHKNWVAACKSNRLVDWCGKHRSLRKIFASFPRSAFTVVTLKNGDQYWTCTKVMTLKKGGRVRIVATHSRADCTDEPNFFATNRTDWSAKRILDTYCVRWTIETFYRDAKQNLGLEDCELRIWNGIKRHFQLVFLAFTLLQLSSLNRQLGKWFATNIKTIGGKCQLAAVEILRSFILFVARESAKQRPVDEIVELCFRPAAQLRFTFA